jgi:hypothetical protein
MRRAGTSWWLAAVATLPLLLAGCSKRAPDRRAELEPLLQSGQIAELRARVQRYQGAGERSAGLDYYLGVGLLRDEDDKPALVSFQSAVTADSTLAVPIGRELQQAALRDVQAGWGNRATARMLEAYRYDPRVDLGGLTPTVARQLYTAKDYRAAVPLYAKLDAAGDGPELSRQEWRWCHGQCLDQLGRDDEALDVYRSYRRDWPASSLFRRRVVWRYQSTLLEKAEAALPTDPAAALRFAEEELAPGMNRALLQRGRVLAARAHEAAGRPADALHWYEEIVKNASAPSDTVAEQAQRRIEALHVPGAQ